MEVKYVLFDILSYVCFFQRQRGTYKESKLINWCTKSFNHVLEHYFDLCPVILKYGGGIYDLRNSLAFVLHLCNMKRTRKVLKCHLFGKICELKWNMLPTYEEVWYFKNIFDMRQSWCKVVVKTHLFRRWQISWQEKYKFYV